MWGGGGGGGVVRREMREGGVNVCRIAYTKAYEQLHHYTKLFVCHVNSIL